jgi:Tol biopolymer transport system component
MLAKEVVPMKRLVTIALVGTTLALGLSSVQLPVQAKAPGPNGQIAFMRQDPTICTDCTSVYTVNPDGTHEKLLFRSAGTPYWSPDGTQISVLADCSFGGSCSATLVDPDTGAVRTLLNPDPALYNEFFSCNRWSPDGTRLACDVVSDTPGFTGLYTIRSSDGGGLTRVLSCATECGATDWSPDGKRFVIAQADPVNVEIGQLFVVRVNGAGLRQITPSDFVVDLLNGTASWSPTGNRIIFGGRSDPDHRRSIFVVNADGSGFQQVPIPGCGGALSDPRSLACYEPGWAPDGTKIVFVRSSPNLGTRAVYTANADGSGVVKVTNPTNLVAFSPDWGTHPATT